MHEKAHIFIAPRMGVDLADMRHVRTAQLLAGLR